jgi:transposase-like protein
MDGRYAQAVFGHLQDTSRPGIPHGGEVDAQLAAEYGVHPTQLGKWKALTLNGLPSLFEERSDIGALKTAHKAQITALYAEIGRLTTQVAWLKKIGLPPG